jgi:hypothetical protein
MGTCMFMISRCIYLRMRNSSYKDIEKLKRTFCVGCLFPDNCEVYDNVDKYGRATQANCVNITRSR